MSDGEQDDSIEDVLAAAEEVLGVIRRNKDLIDGFVGGAGTGVNTLGMSDDEPLKKMFKSEDRIEVVVEVPEDSLENIGFSPFEDGVDIEAGEKVYRAMTPSDVDLKEAKVTFNNGVLTVRIPRTGDTEVGVQTEIIDKEVSIEEDDTEEDEEEDGGED